MEIFDTLAYYMQFSQVRYALIVGVLVALCASLLGVTLVLKRFSFIGDGLSHVAFGAMAVSSITGALFSGMKPLIDGTGDMIIVMPLTVISAVLLLRTGKNAKVKGDAAVAMISVGALAIGYLLMNLDVFPKSANISGDVCSTLFGSLSILTLTQGEVNFCIAVSIAVVIVFILLYNKLFSVTFDEDFATATGTKASVYNLIIAIIIAVIIVISMNLVGSLLISALIIFPALSAMRLLKSFKAVTICSACLSVFCATLGILLSILFSTPVGSTIVAVDIAAFGVFSLIGAAKGGLKK